MLYYFNWLCDQVFMWCGGWTYYIEFRLNETRIIPTDWRVPSPRKDKPIQLPSSYG